MKGNPVEPVKPLSSKEKGVRPGGRVRNTILGGISIVLSVKQCTW